MARWGLLSGLDIGTVDDADPGDIARVFGSETP